MTEKHVLPEEVRMIIDLLARDGLGQEGEGSYPAVLIEQKLQDAGVSSTMFGEHFPKISPELKAGIGRVLLYDAGLSMLGLDLNAPQMRMDENGVYKLVSTKKHLEQLLRIWTILEQLSIEKDEIL